MKLLNPTSREKKRYVLFQIDGCSWENCWKEILNQIKSFMGEFLYGVSGVFIVDNLSNGNYFVLKIKRKYLDYLKASIIFINEVNNQKVRVRSLLISGTLLKIKQKIKEVNLNGFK